MTTTPTRATIPTLAPTMSTTAGRTVSDTIVRSAALALLVGGPASMALNILWRIGHGPTVINEHGVVLGLTNDEWSYLGPLWAVPVAWAVAVLMTLHAGWTARATAWLTGTGLVVGAAAAWIFPLFSLGWLALAAGLACLSVTLWRGRVLARWLAVPPALAVVAFVPFVFWSDTVYAVEATLAATSVNLADLPVLALALTWTALGVALLRRG
jgi:hypothetical protein